MPPALAVESAAGVAGSSPLGCVLERSRRLCLNLYRKEMLTADSAVESALKWVCVKGGGREAYIRGEEGIERALGHQG